MLSSEQARSCHQFWGCHFVCFSPFFNSFPQVYCHLVFVLFYLDFSFLFLSFLSSAALNGFHLLKVLISESGSFGRNDEETILS